VDRTPLHAGLRPGLGADGHVNSVDIVDTVILNFGGRRHRRLSWCRSLPTGAERVGRAVSAIKALDPPSWSIRPVQDVSFGSISPDTLPAEIDPFRCAIAAARRASRSFKKHPDREALQLSAPDDIVRVAQIGMY
jgi:hypothetical protein